MDWRHEIVFVANVGSGVESGSRWSAVAVKDGRISHDKSGSFHADFGVYPATLIEGT